MLERWWEIREVSDAFWSGDAINHHNHSCTASQHLARHFGTTCEHIYAWPSAGEKKCGRFQASKLTNSARFLLELSCRDSSYLQLNDFLLFFSIACLFVPVCFIATPTPSPSSKSHFCLHHHWLRTSGHTKFPGHSSGQPRGTEGFLVGCLGVLSSVASLMHSAPLKTVFWGCVFSASTCLDLSQGKIFRHL